MKIWDLSTENLEKTFRGHDEIQINGPCRLIYRPDAPQCFGATVWIETLSPVNVI
ncbi:MAG: hypothetical protein QNJ08_21040 [Crocosphaera sp.]|nr:hypothetical protein [Crocosphaera sp.]